MKNMLLLCFLGAFFGPVYSQLKLENTQTPEFYVQNVLLGEDIHVFNITYTGKKGALGQFEADSSILGVKSGIILTSGNADSSIAGVNKSNGFTSYAEAPRSTSMRKKMRNGDRDLNRITGKKAEDMCVLEFDFIPVKNKLEFNYIFASEEYPEFVNKSYNDVFGFFLSGRGIFGKVNLAFITKGKKMTPITINSINHGKNSRYFRKNYTRQKNNLALYNYIEFDGLTTVLKVQYDIVPYQVYHIKIAVADMGDDTFDTAVMLEAGSFISVKNENGKYYDQLLEIEKNPVNIDSLVLKKTKQPATINKDSLEEEIINEADFTISNIYFDYNSSAIPDSSAGYLQELIKYLSDNPGLQVSLYGYTDAVGSKKFNLSLSEKRAAAIRDYLISQGVQDTRIRYQGLGIAEEDTNGDTEEGKKKRRRVEIVLE